MVLCKVRSSCAAQPPHSLRLLARQSHTWKDGSSSYLKSEILFILSSRRPWCPRKMKWAAILVPFLSTSTDCADLSDCSHVNFGQPTPPGSRKAESEDRGRDLAASNLEAILAFNVNTIMMPSLRRENAAGSEKFGNKTHSESYENA